MINKELARIEKMLKMINRNNELDFKDIIDVKIEKFEKEAILTTTNENNSSKIFTVLRKDFEGQYNIGWEE